MENEVKQEPFDVIEDGEFEEIFQEEEEEGFLKRAGNWCKSHQKGIMTGLTLATPIAIELVKSLLKRGELKEERALKELMIYDRDHGHSVEAGRKLSSSEWRQFDLRRDRGEAASEILYSMGLLKDED